MKFQESVAWLLGLVGGLGDCLVDKRPDKISGTAWLEVGMIQEWTGFTIPPIIMEVKNGNFQ